MGRSSETPNASGSLSASISRPAPAGATLIRPRPRVGIGHVLALSLVFAGLASVIALADLVIVDFKSVARGEPSPATVRIPTFAGFRGDETTLAYGGVLIERGEVASETQIAAAAEVLPARPHGLAGWATFAIGLFILCAFFSSALRSAHRGKLMRHQAVLLLSLLVTMVAIKAATIFTVVSILAMPVATLTLLARSAVDRASATAMGLFAAFSIAVLVPFDAGVITVLVAQAVAPVLLLGDSQHSRRRVVLAAVAGGLAAVAAYFAYALLSWGALPTIEPQTIHRSGAVAAFIGGLASGPLAILLLPPLQVLLGEVTAARLVALEDFSNPLLQQIADRSPGTWQHSLAMANMAETAANAVGADGRLVRTGAYYHDLGKSLQPKYFIENLSKGEPSPHDSLAPEVSADVIFAHVTEGVRLGRKHGLPERIIDFMHMHHGDGRLEYFWSKCQELGNPNGLDEKSFCYPGLRPQSKETAVLAIVDAVEAASRTLRSADDKSTRNLVQRIVYGKLHLGQLDESGLTMSDLRKISEALVKTIKAAHHGRIEYPWQREEAAAEKDSTERETRHLGKPERGEVRIDTGRIMGDVRLDSLDAPRPGWRARTANPREVLDSSASLRPIESPVDPATQAPVGPSASAPMPQAPPPGSASAPSAAGSSASMSAPPPPPPPPSESSSAIEGPAQAPPQETADMRPPSADASESRRLPPALVIEDAVPSAPIPRPAPDSIPIEPGDSAILLESAVPTTSTGPAPVSGPKPASVPARGSVDEAPEAWAEQGSPSDPGADEMTEPRVPALRRSPRKSSTTGRLAEWEAALEKALPPAPEKKRPGRNTLALLKAGDAESVLEPLERAESGESGASALSLSPGTMVVGPPPETHARQAPPPRKSLDRSDQAGADETLEVRLPLPAESVRPSKRETAEHEVAVPPEAFPDDTEPSVVTILKKEK